MSPNPTYQLFFILQLENILQSHLNFSTSYGRLTDLKSLLRLFLVSFIWLGEKNSLKYFLIGGGGGGTFVPLIARCPSDSVRVHKTKFKIVD